MDEKHAEQIADLLNSHNKLVVPYTKEKILASSNNYVYETDGAGDVSGCIETKKVQWYQFEVRHLTVNPKHRRKGLGRSILHRAESYAQNNRGRIIQCTIREDNEASKRLFESNGFVLVSTFYYPDSGNNVTVWQKVISLSGAT